MTRQLIVDVGMCDGTDTEFYLKKGFDVLSIEANPDYVADVAQRLAGYVTSGQLTILHCAVAEHEGETEFLVSERPGWGSLPNEWGNSRQALGVGHRTVQVPCTTFDQVLPAQRTPYYVKIDVEGADLSCVRALARMESLPQYVSFECNPIAGDETFEMLRLLEERGYRRFKLVNQALNPEVTLPNPPLEGDYVDQRFGAHSSGAFGEEAPGSWESIPAVRDRISRVFEQQAARAQYTQTGTLYGVPIGRFHNHLERIYNARPVRSARRTYASLRRQEVGGWFDVHASL